MGIYPYILVTLEDKNALTSLIHKGYTLRSVTKKQLNVTCDMVTLGDTSCDGYEIFSLSDSSRCWMP